MKGSVSGRSEGKVRGPSPSRSREFSGALGREEAPASSTGMPISREPGIHPRPNRARSHSSPCGGDAPAHPELVEGGIAAGHRRLPRPGVQTEVIRKVRHRPPRTRGKPRKPKARLERVPWGTGYLSDVGVCRKAAKGPIESDSINRPQPPQLEYSLTYKIF